ncbi:MAG: DUF4397 domain-containing protein [Bacteroidota bacterium]
MKKTILSVVAVLALALSFTSCKKDEVVGTGYIQFTNAAELASPLDFYASDVKKTSSPLAYNQSSGYLEVSAKAQPANIKVGATGISLMGFTITPLAGAYYSVFYISDGFVAAFQDPLSVPPTGKAKVRFVNFNIGATVNNDFSISGGAKIVNNLAVKEVSDYFDVAPGAAFTAYNTGSTTALLNIPTTIEAGHIYTVYLSGKDLAGLKATVLLQK